MYRVSRKYVGNGTHELQCRLFQETLPTFHQQLMQKKKLAAYFVLSQTNKTCNYVDLIKL